VLIVSLRRPMISVAAAAGLCEAIERAGRNPDEILRPLGLRREVLASASGRIPAADFALALEEAARLTGDDCFGLHLGEHYHPKNAGPLAYVVLNSPTMAVAFTNIARYLHALNEAADVSFERTGRWTYLRHTLDLPVEQSRQQAELSLAVGLGLIRMMVGSDWSPVEVQFAHKAPSSAAEHVRVFGAPVTFGCGTNAFVVESDLSDRHVPGADQRLYPIMVRYLDRILEAMPREDGLVVSVRKRIGEAMRQGDPTLAQVADQLSVAARTLQRKLRECGVDFKHLVEDTRRRFSVQYLDDHSNTLTDVAFLLGYSEVSAFNRAFKRWTGSTPSDYRRRRHAGGD
jgi:AraC-like DNA-binding protein